MDMKMIAILSAFFVVCLASSCSAATGSNLPTLDLMEFLEKKRLYGESKEFKIFDFIKSYKFLWEFERDKDLKLTTLERYMVSNQPEKPLYLMDYDDSRLFRLSQDERKELFDLIKQRVIKLA
ncbi:hypothetical protein HELRODRAFT_178775 [Helobdella robusta]|uniref:Selenoprotein F/M domain-containing protein n=1 Tax=Helobdella robusta TaxID=6412 RepID=T1FDQ2_HELRO|nr:hypothetical protein HELRODRAFT_178775 [Helobdella robusta]ESN96971.1 hypothetical protein HELRODRAFT_178775 [Helobdella robusta]